MTTRESAALLEGMNDKEKAIHYKQLLEDQQKEVAKLKRQAQATKPSEPASNKQGGGGRRTPKKKAATNANDDDEDPNRDGDVAAAVAGQGALVMVDVGDNTKGSQDYNAVSQIFKKCVWRTKKWSNSRTEGAVALLTLDSMQKKGYMLTGDRHMDMCK